MSSEAWDATCQREALRRIYELAAEAVARTGEDVDKIGELSENGQREEWFAQACFELGLNKARTKREVRRVRALATGRLIREEAWLAVDPAWRPGDVEHSGGPDPEKDARRCVANMGKGWRVRRVLRIKRAAAKGGST